LKVLAVLAALYLPAITTVYAQIISGPFGVSEVKYGIEELAVAYKDILATLAKINDPQAAFNPSPEACRYCPAVNICQATKNLILPIARLQHSALPDGEKAAKLLDEIELLENHIKSIRSHYYEQISGDPEYKIPGWGLVQGVPKRTVTDWAAARKRLEEFLDAEELSKTESYTLSTVERALGKKLGLRAEKLKIRFAEILTGVIEEKFPRPSLKRVRLEEPVLDRISGELKLQSLT
jgi:hypothetical protein